MTTALYSLVVPNGSAAPTPAQIVAGVNYGAVTVLAAASVPYTSAGTYDWNSFPVTGASSGTSYTQWMVPYDSAAGTYGYATSGVITSVSLAAIYHITVVHGSTAPTPAQIVAGANYGAVTVFGSGSINYSGAGTIDDTAHPVSGLTPGVSYDQWFVASDTSVYGPAIVGVITTTAVASAFNGAVTLDDSVAAGAMSSSPTTTSVFSGAVALDDCLPAGAFITTPSVQPITPTATPNAVNVTQTLPKNTSAFLTLAFYDVNGNLASPASITFQIDDMGLNQNVRASTTVSNPGATFTLELLPTDNSIINSTDFLEYRRLTVYVNSGGSDVHMTQYDWIVNNIPYN